MSAFQQQLLRAIPVLMIATASPLAIAQDGESGRITEKDKQVFRDFMDGRKQKARLTDAIMNLRQIGLGMFEFESEYGEFPNERTAAMVKEATETKKEIKGATANDCFYQLMAAEIIALNLFTFEKPVANPENPRSKPAKLDKCAYSYISGLNAAGNPSRPLVVAPLVKGKTTFDPKILAGRAVVLYVDNSVRSFPIENDGRVLIDGKDLFDPAQPFWGGKVPPVKWPEE